jgi:hypothetical protein
MRDDEEMAYTALLDGLRSLTISGPVFTTDAEALDALFLEHLPPHRRQHYDCRACRAFLARFGGLVTIDELGASHSPLWETHAPWPFFGESVDALCSAARRTGARRARRACGTTYTS